MTEPAAPARVSTLELFFDLVFVFTVTQATAALADDLSVRGLVRVLLMVAIIWWMYGGYAWLTNAIAPDSRVRRTLILVGMGGFLTIALAIPDAFGDAGWAFGVGYFVVNAVHTGLFLTVSRAMRVLGVLNLITATLVLAGGFAPGVWRYVLWGAAMALLIASPRLNPIHEFTISAAHFVERHGLVVIIALGESLIAIGVGAAGLAVDWRLIGAAVLGLTVSYLMWWVYFEGGDGGAEHALEAVPMRERAWVAIVSYGYAHYVLLIGIVAVAAGIKKAVGHVDGHLTLGQALLLGGGVAAYLLGDVGSAAACASASPASAWSRRSSPWPRCRSACGWRPPNYWR
ncbi:low temperature requirement protein A [Luedemannella flava]